MRKSSENFFEMIRKVFSCLIDQTPLVDELSTGLMIKLLFLGATLFLDSAHICIFVFYYIFIFGC